MLYSELHNLTLSLPDSYAEQMEQEMSEVWSNLCSDPAELEAIATRHYNWCVAHKCPTRALAIPMANLNDAIAHGCLPDDDFDYDAPLFTVFSYRDKKVASSIESVAELDESSIGDAIDDLDEAYNYVGDILCHYGDIAERYEERRRREREADNRAICRDTPYAYSW